MAFLARQAMTAFGIDARSLVNPRFASQFRRAYSRDLSVADGLAPPHPSKPPPVSDLNSVKEVDEHSAKTFPAIDIQTALQQACCPDYRKQQGVSLVEALDCVKERFDIRFMAHSTKCERSAEKVEKALRTNSIEGELCVGTINEAYNHGDASYYCEMVLMAVPPKFRASEYSFIPSVRCLTQESSKFGETVLATTVVSRYSFQDLFLHQSRDFYFL